MGCQQPLRQGMALRQAGELGFMGMYTPEQAGGLAMPRLDASLIVEELAKGCTTTAAFLTIHNMATNMIGRYCQQEVIDEWCPDLVSGKKLASYCLTEPGAGSDAAALRTSAVTDGDHYVINGSKAFISGAGETDVLVLMLRTGDAGPKGVTAILVPADADGISYGKNEHKMGWNAQPTRAITFDDVRVPKKNRLGEEGQEFAIAMDGWTTVESTSPPAALAPPKRPGRRHRLRAGTRSIRSGHRRLSSNAVYLIGHAHRAGGRATNDSTGSQQTRQR